MLSILVPVYNQDRALIGFFDRLYAALDGLASPYEVIFVDGGSQDRSATLLRQQHQLRPAETRVILLYPSAGLSAAHQVGLGQCRGERILRIGPEAAPEIIPQVIAALDQGRDWVGVVAPETQMPRWLQGLNWLLAQFSNRLFPGAMPPDCQYYACERALAEAAMQSGKGADLLPVLLFQYAQSPSTLPLDRGSAPDFSSVIQRHLQRITGLSPAPLQAFSTASFLLGLSSLFLTVLLVLYQVLAAAALDGVSILLDFFFFFLGFLLLGISLLSQYLSHCCESQGQPPIAYQLAPRNAHESKHP